MLEFLGTFVFLSIVLRTGSVWLVGLGLAISLFFNPLTQGGHNPLVLGMNVAAGKVGSDDAMYHLGVQIAAAAAAFYVHKNFDVLKTVPGF